MAARERLLFSEPSGRRLGLAFLCLSTVSLLGWVYFAVLLDGPHILLFIGVSLGLSGVAESLSPDQRRLAGVLRVSAIGLLVGFLVLLTSAPELVMG
jgi:hypothetical protein